MRSIKLSMLAALMLTAGITTVKAQTGDEIIQKHIDAIGGTDNWNKINSIKRIASMSVQGMEVGFNMTIVKDKGMRMDISLMGQNGYVIVTPAGGWMYMPMQGVDKVTPLPEDQVKGSKDKINVKAGMLADKSNIAKSEYIGKDTVNSVSCFKVKVTDKNGDEQTDFFDATTYYLVRTEMTVKAQESEQEVAASYSNFQKQPEGIVIPMTFTSPTGGGDIVVKSVEINKPIDESIFKPVPAK